MFDLNKFILFEADGDSVHSIEWAAITNGCLYINGQDFPKTLKEAWASEEFEYAYSFTKEHTERLIVLLFQANGESDAKKMTAKAFKELLLAHYGDYTGCRRIRVLCEKNHIQYKLLTWY